MKTESKLIRMSKQDLKILEKEALRRGVSQSELVRQLILNSATGYDDTKIKKIEESFLRIMKTYEELVESHALALSAIRYLIVSDPRTKDKIIAAARKDGKNKLVLFLLEEDKNE